MADLCQAFSRIVPRYEFHPNQAVMVVEDLDSTLGRCPLKIGWPQRPIQQTNKINRPCTCGNRYCYTMQSCCDK